jgi:hypothetical protein
VAGLTPDRGTFQNPEREITRVLLANDTDVIVEVGGGTGNVVWSVDTSVDGAEHFRTGTQTQGETSFFDQRTVAGDFISVEQVMGIGVGAPDTPVVVDPRSQPGDDPFFDILIV